VAIDMLDDTVVIGLLPAAMVLVGADRVLAGVGRSWAPRWRSLRGLPGAEPEPDARYVAKRRATLMDSALGGKLADSIAATRWVKSFGAEAR